MPLLVHFKPKQADKGREKEKIKIVVPFHSNPALNKKFKKFAKKFKKLKNTLIDSFLAKISWKMNRWRENKNYRSVPFLPGTKQKFKKKQQKNSKN